MLADTLLIVRRITDRMEQILAEFLVMQATIRNKVRESRHATDSAWNEAARTSRSGGDLAPRERYARYDVKAMESRMEQMRREKFSTEIDAGVEVVKLFTKSLGDLRWTLDSRLRAMTLDTNLEGKVDT